MRILVVFSFLLIQVVGFSQFNWERTYGGWGDDKAYAVKQDLDTGFIIVGSTSSFYHQTQFYMVKVSKTGELVWTKHLGGEGIEKAYDVSVTSDSGYAVVGVTNSTSNDYNILFARLTKTGDTLFTKNFGGEDWDFAYAMAQLPDSGYVIAGETYSYGEGNNDAYLVRINKTGDTLWTKTFGGAGNEFFKDVILTQNNEILAVGSTNTTGNGGSDFYIVQTDLNGTTLYEHTQGYPEDEEATKVLELNSGEFIVAGRLFNSTELDWDGWMIKTNNSNTLLDQVFKGNYTSGGYYNQQISGIAKFKNQDSIVLTVDMVQTGLVHSFITAEKLQLSAGFPAIPGTVFSKYVSSQDDIFVTDVDTCFDGGFIYCGYGNGTIGSSADKPIYIIKTGINNQSGCGDISASCIQNKYDLSSGFIGIDNGFIENDHLIIYPNPTQTGEVNLVLPTNAYFIKFVNVLGQEQSFLSATTKINLQELNINKGVYTVLILDQSWNLLISTKIIYKD